ncbi:MAG: hypothetical protein ACREI3_09065 [Nitrospirales bacterium]
MPRKLVPPDIAHKFTVIQHHLAKEFPGCEFASPKCPDWDHYEIQFLHHGSVYTLCLPQALIDDATQPAHDLECRLAHEQVGRQLRDDWSRVLEWGSVDVQPVSHT